jgi:acetolactate synthase-1/2/3 large subunit
MARRASDVLVSGLEAHGIERVYCVPGESYLALLDSLHDSNRIETITCRHESGAGFMAVAESKLTGKPAVFAVSRGPGATNGSIAIHVAEQDAVPVVVLIGQVSREERGRDAFQEVDYGQFFGGMAKWVCEVNDGWKLPETLARAFHIAQSGTPGPVVIVLPEDMLSDEIEGEAVGPLPVHLPEADPAQVAAAAQALMKAERPLIIAGGQLQGPGGREALEAAAQAFQLPVALSWKNQDLFDNSSPLYAGHLGFKTPKAHIDLLAEADVILAVGARLGDVATQGFTFPSAPEPAQTLIHVYPDPARIGRVFRTDVGVVADAASFLRELSVYPGQVPESRNAWIGKISGFISEFTAWAPRQADDGIDFGEVVQAIAETARDDAIVITDGGNFSSWVHRHWKLKPQAKMLAAIAGAMGFGIPAGVTSGHIAPDRQSIIVVGDGGAMMTGNELATAIMLGSAPKIFVSNNGTYGTIRLHQERDYPERVVATDLANPSFAKWGEAFGAKAFSIGAGDDVAAIVADALACETAAVIDVHSSAEAISAFTTISKLRGN